MVSSVTTEGDRGKLVAILAALRESASRTRRYFVGSMIFYAVMIAVFAILVATAEDQEARGANIGILILVSLGFLGMWISALRGLRGSKITPGAFLNLFRLPLEEEISRLEDESVWNSEDEQLQSATRLLEHQAEAEKEHLAWTNRLLSLSVITIIDLIIWLVWDNWVMALVNQGIAMIVSQAHISMGPRSAMKALASLKQT